MSPLFPPLPAPGGDSIGDSVTYFKRDLLEYLAAYRHSRVTKWADVIKQHDLSAAKWDSSCCDSLMWLITDILYVKNVPCF